MSLRLFLIEIEGKPDEFDRAGRSVAADSGFVRLWTVGRSPPQVDEAFGPLAPMRTDDGKDAGGALSH